MRSPMAVLLAVAALGVASLVVMFALRDTELVYTLGVPDTGVAVTVPPGQEACQEPIPLPDGDRFDRVRMRIEGGAGILLVRELPSRRVLARGPIADTNGEQRIRVGEVAPRGAISVCVRAATGRLHVHGSAGLANRNSGVGFRGRPIDVDMLVAFEGRPRSLLSLVPAMGERAALWRPGFVGEWTYAVLGLLVLLGVPLALAFAVRWASPSAAAPEEPPPG
jgi:hypothetical protein